MLKELNFTDVENRIFSEILSLGSCSAGELTKRLALHKGTAYNSLRRLKEKGYLSEKAVDGIRVYSINALYIKQLKDSIEEAHKREVNEVDLLLKRIELSRRGDEAARIEVLTGDAGFKSFFKSLYQWAKGEKEYLFLGRGNEMLEHFGAEYYARTQAEKKRLGIKCRVILNKSSLRLPVSKYVAGNVRYLEMESASPTSIWLWNNTVTIVLWQSKPILTINIFSKESYKSFKSHFESLWKVAGKEK